MGKYFNSITELVGNTPLLRLNNIEKKFKTKAEIYAKLEYFNPAGSVKDRIALSMINEAEEQGIVTKDTVIIEPTSGNTGIGLAMVCASRGYRLIITMPETMSVERRNIIKAYGAEVILTDGKMGMKGAILKAGQLAKEFKSSFIPSQFVNPVNPMCHRVTTGKEIYQDLNGNVDIFVAGVGTGGTISGVGEYLKSKNPNVKIVAVEPFDSPIISGGKVGTHKIQGIGAGFIPDILNTEIFDEIIKVKNDDAFKLGRTVAQAEGVLVGISSGAALWAGLQLATLEENKGKKIVVLMPDTGERYLSTEMFNF